MASKIEDHGAEHTRRLADHLPCVQSINSAKTTAATDDRQPKSTKTPQKSPQLRQELLDSAIPEHLHDQLGYTSVTAKEAFELVGQSEKGWAIPFKDPQGNHYLTSKEKLFID